MTLIVETGSIVPNANSYVSLTDADTFHTDRGNSKWIGTNAVKEAALVRATDYIEQNYASRWNGSLIDYEQSLSWPRHGVCDVDSTVIPKELKAAVCTLALEALKSDLNPSLARGGAIKRRKVDVIETEYADNAPGTTKRPAIDGLLSRFLTGGSYMGRVNRVM